jgi:hypothetical protein
MICSVCGKKTRYHAKTAWSLFKKDGRRWVQVHQISFGKCDAIRYFQSHLLLGLGELRRVKTKDLRQESLVDD